MNDPDRREPANTEATAATPGWVETELDEILATLPPSPELAVARGRYLDGLAAARGPIDAAVARDRARRRFLQALDMGEGDTGELERRLERLEADIEDRT